MEWTQRLLRRSERARCGMPGSPAPPYRPAHESPTDLPVPVPGLERLHLMAGSTPQERIAATAEEEVVPASAERDSLLRAGASGVFWQGLAQVVGKMAVLATTVVLARLLATEEFGRVALPLVLIPYAEAFPGAGVAQALISLPRTREI